MHGMKLFLAGSIFASMLWFMGFYDGGWEQVPLPGRTGIAPATAQSPVICIRRIGAPWSPERGN